MTLKENIRKSRKRKLVSEDKFDLHMKKARLQDLECRKSIFCNQADSADEADIKKAQLKNSVY